MNNYVYEVGDNLYINLTNKCSNSCFSAYATVMTA